MLVIANNTASTVFIRDLGYVVDASGQISLTRSQDIEDATRSDDLATLLTDDSVGVGISTLKINDGVGDVPQAEAIAFLEGADHKAVIANRIVVAKSGGDFQTINPAILEAAGADSDNPVTIAVYPGKFATDPFTLPSYVAIESHGGPQFCILETTDNANHFITGSPSSWITGLGIKGPTGTGKAAVYYDAESVTPFFMRYLLIRAGYYGIWGNQAPAGSGGSRGVMHVFNCSNEYIGLATQEFIKASGYANITSKFSGWTNGPSGALVSRNFSAEGPEAELYLHLCQSRALGAASGVYVDNGGYAKLKAMSLNKGISALHIGPNGSGSKIESTGSHIRTGNFTDDFKIEAAGGIISFDGGHADKNSLNIVAGGILNAAFGDDTPGEEGFVIDGEIWVGSQGASIPLATYAHEVYGTGWISGGVVSRNSAPSLNVDVTSGVGYINDGVKITRVSWSAAGPIALIPNATNWIYVADTGVILASASKPDPLTVVILAVVETNATAVVLTSRHVDRSPQSFVNRRLYTERVMGPLVVDGTVATIHAAPSLQIAVDSGNHYTANVLRSTVGGAPITFSYWYRDGSGGWVKTIGNTTVEPGNIDTKTGSPTTMAGGKYKKDLLFVSFGDGTEYHIIYGQEEFNTQLDAESGNNPTAPSIVLTEALRVAGVVCQEATTAITSLVDQLPRMGQFSSGSTSVTDHGLLSGLSDDDHPQYHRTDGSRVMTGNLDMGTNQIVNVGNVDGISVSIHQARHRIGGLDPLPPASTTLPGLVELADAAETVTGTDTSRAVTPSGIGVKANSNPLHHDRYLDSEAVSAQGVKADGNPLNHDKYIHPNHSGDVTSIGDGAQVIAPLAVTNPKLANMAQSTLKGRAVGAGTGSPQDLTSAQVLSLIGGGAPPMGIVEGTSFVSTTSSSAPGIALPGMSITPAAGKYLFSFSAYCATNNKEKDITFAIYVDGVQVTASVRILRPKDNSSKVKISVHSQVLATVNGAQLVEVRWWVTSGTTAYCWERQMSYVKGS